MIQLVVYQAFIVRNMAHQGIRTERDPHSIPGQIVGSDLLVQLQFYFGENMGIMADAVCPGAGIISVSPCLTTLTSAILPPLTST